MALTKTPASLIETSLDLTGHTLTVATQSASDNSTAPATTAYVTTALANLVDSAPGTLNTLNELAAALGDDANFSTTVTNSIATKLPLAGGTMTGDLTISTAGPSILLTDTDNNPDYQIKNGNGSFRIIDTTNSVDRININTSGNVGIGTTSPRYNLTVNGNNSTAVGIAVDNASGSSTLDIAALGSGYNSHQAGPGEVWFYSPDNINIGGATGSTNDIKFLSNNTVNMVIKGDSGKVGIGTSSPTKSLSVKAPSSSNGGIDVFHNNGNKVAELVHHGSGDEGRLSLYDGGTGTVQLHGETGQLSFINSGKVIIGDTASHVDDLLQIETPASGGGHGIQIRRNDSNGDQGIGRIMFGNNNDTDLATISSITDGQADCARLVFSTQPTSGSSTERMRIDSSGNVTHGTSKDNYIDSAGRITSKVQDMINIGGDNWHSMARYYNSFGYGTGGQLSGYSVNLTNGQNASWYAGLTFTGYVTWLPDVYIPYAIGQVYGLSATFFQHANNTAGTAVQYVGCIGYDANFNFVNYDAIGTYQYNLVSSGTFTAGATTEIDVTLKGWQGSGQSDGNKMDRGTVYIRPMMLINYPWSSASGGTTPQTTLMSFTMGPKHTISDNDSNAGTNY